MRHLILASVHRNREGSIRQSRTPDLLEESDVEDEVPLDAVVLDHAPRCREFNPMPLAVVEGQRGHLEALADRDRHELATVVVDRGRL